jgi:peptide/nickel transport system permease protein
MDNYKKDGWARFLSNPLSSASLILLILIFLLASFAYLIIPDNTPNANRQHLELATKKPGFRVQFIKRKINEPKEQQSFLEIFFMGREKQFEHYSLSSYSIHNDSITIKEYSEDQVSGLERRFHILDMAFAVEMEKGISYSDESFHFFDNEINDHNQIEREVLLERIKSELIFERKFLLGTDRFGRDMFSRLLLGARISIAVGFIAVAISLLIGILMGSLAGYYKGRVDDIIMWLINVIWSIPTLLLVIALTMVLGKGFWQIFVAVGLTMWVEVARIVRGEVLSQSKLEYVDAAKVTGLSDLRILFRHILPNIVSPVIIIAASNFASAILIEAGLSFLGIGVQPPVPSWGSMIRDHYGYIIVDKAYLAFIPGISIMLLVLAFTMIGNGLRDSFDVKGK